MKAKNTFSCWLAALLLASCGGADVQKLSDGIIVNIDQEQPTRKCVFRFHIYSYLYTHATKIKRIP